MLKINITVAAHAEGRSSLPHEPVSDPPSGFKCASPRRAKVRVNPVKISLLAALFIIL